MVPNEWWPTLLAILTGVSDLQEAIKLDIAEYGGFGPVPPNTSAALSALLRLNEELA